MLKLKQSIRQPFFIVAILIFISPILTQGQKHYLYLNPNNQSAYPATDTSTNNSTLNAIFIKYAVKKYEQSFPYAINPEVANTFHIYATGNIDSLKTELLNTNLFSEILKADFYKSAICTSPKPSVNDLEITSGRRNNWALDNIEANCAWSITEGDPRVVLAIVDTDIDTFHNDMRNKFVSKWFADLTSDYSLHGSKVSGFIFATTNNSLGIAGLANKIKGASYRAGGISLADPSIPPADSTSCYGNPWPAIWQAYLDGRQVINVSWTGIGGYYSAIEEITQHGVNLVVAAGNRQEYGPSHSTYANIPGVINVSSINWENKHGTTSTNPDLQHEHNAWVDLCSPGVDVTTLNAFNRYHTSTATSIATPVVSGVIALMLSVNPCLSPNEVEYILKQTCDPIVNASSYPSQLGAGRVNAYKAVKMAQETSCMNIAIEINTLCRPGKVGGVPNPQFTVKMEGGTPPYTYKWEPIVYTPGAGIWNNATLDNHNIGNPTVIATSPATPTAPHIAYYRLIVTDASAVKKMAIRTIKVMLSNELSPIVAMRDSYMDMLREPNDQVDINAYV